MPTPAAGWTPAAPLHAAAYWGHADVVELLIEGGTDIECRDLQWHSSPLCSAAVGSGEGPSSIRPADWVATVRALLGAGASARDAWVETKPPSAEVATLLRSSGAAGQDVEAPKQEERPAADPALVDQVARGLRHTFEAGDLDLRGSLLDPDVRWGGAPAAAGTGAKCWNGTGCFVTGSVSRASVRWLCEATPSSSASSTGTAAICLRRSGSPAGRSSRSAAADAPPE
jgi:hypothetical protein